MKWLTDNAHHQMSRIDGRWIQLMIVVVLLVLFALAAGAPEAGGGSGFG